MKEWTAIGWPTNIQSATPDGKFGPAKQMEDWHDCWFLAALAAVANDQAGRQILAEGIRKVNGGYDVTFKGLPNHDVFISDAELKELLEKEGGDADTRLMELAADKVFNQSGSFQSLYLTYLISGGWNQDQAEQCFQNICRIKGIQDAMTYNPMRADSSADIAIFMFSGRIPGNLVMHEAAVQKSDVAKFLNKYATNDRDGLSVVISGIENPLGSGQYAPYLVVAWDRIRTEITRQETMNEQQRAFLNRLAEWLETRDINNQQALLSAAANLNLEHSDPALYTDTLVKNIDNMNEEHFNLLRTAVLEVLNGGPGYIGFPKSHCGTFEGINAAAGLFTYSEPYTPALVHTGELADLIQAMGSGKIFMTALEPTTERDRQEHFEHAGTSKGRRLSQLHNQAVKDGKIDQAESGPLAELMAMDDVTFRQVYDNDQNGVIEGSELTAVQKRVDRWVDHLELTPIW